jgi:hypothetical protein
MPALSCFHGFLSIFLVHLLHVSYFKRRKNDQKNEKFRACGPLKSPSKCPLMYFARIKNNLMHAKKLESEVHYKLKSHLRSDYKFITYLEQETNKINRFGF